MIAQDITPIKTVLDKASEILVLLPQNPGPDSIASALSLYLSLELAGKQALIACSTPLDFENYPLKQADRITQKVGNKNLVVSLKIEHRDSVDKVSYNLDELNKVFNLIVTPKKNAQPLTADAVSFSLAGARADLIIIVGASGFDDLGSLYAAEPSLFTETPTVAINRLQPRPFASYHLDNPEASSLAEYMVNILESLNLSHNPDTATNLLAAIDVVTDKLLLPTVGPTTFETVAKLIRAGGSRIMLSPSQANESQVKAPAVSQTTPVSKSEAPTPIQVTDSHNQQDGEPEQIPQEWLEPKIYQAPKNSQANIPPKTA
jgi:nanoRNase/pAp phosphatase (c-di-AMP/oligoRNAs hydrolase)